MSGRTLAEPPLCAPGCVGEASPRAAEIWACCTPGQACQRPLCRCPVVPTEALTAAALISRRHNDPMRYPIIEPFDSGVLEAGSGHRVSWERVGNPHGKPAVVLHGGPGSGAQPWWRTYFDPDGSSVTLFVQRGPGRSRPLASEPDIDLSTITTQHLIDDIEALRRLHGVDRWLVFGGSCGSTLALPYAGQPPARRR